MSNRNLAKKWLLLFLIVFMVSLCSLVATATWWNATYLNRYDLNVTDTTGLARINEPIKLNVSGVICANADKRDLRVVDNNDIEQPSQVLSDNQTLVYVANITASYSGRIAYIYCNNSVVAKPTYTTGFNTNYIGTSAFTVQIGDKYLTKYQFLQGGLQNISSNTVGVNQSGSFGFKVAKCAGNYYTGAGLASGSSCTLIENGTIYSKIRCTSGTAYTEDMEFYYANPLFKFSPLVSTSLCNLGTYQLTPVTTRTALPVRRYYNASNGLFIDASTTNIAFYKGILGITANPANDPTQNMGIFLIYNKTALDGFTNADKWYVESRSGSSEYNFIFSVSADGGAGTANYTVLGSAAGKAWYGYANQSDEVELNNTYTKKMTAAATTLGTKEDYTIPDVVTLNTVFVNQAYDNDNLQCFVNATGSNTTIIANFEWLNGTTSYNTGSYNVSNATYTQISTITAEYTTVGDNWTCKVRAQVGSTYSDYTNTSRKIFGVILIFSDPANINVGNLWNNPMLSYYRYADSDVVPGSFILKHKTNTTTSDISYFINGVAYSGWINSTRTTNTTTNVTVTTSENEVLPASYNLDPFLMLNTTHASGTLNGNNVRLYMRIANLSTNVGNSILEFMANATASGAPTMTVRYCNNSFNPLIGGDPIGNTNCGICGSIAATVGYNHTHSNSSKHNLITFNATGNKLCNVGSNGVGYFVFTSPSGTNGWQYYYYPNANITNAFLTSTNGGGTVTPINGIFDMHTHQYNNNTVYQDYLQYTKVNGTVITSAIRYDTLENVPLPPTSVEVLTPVNGTYGGLVSITWTAAQSNLGQIARYVGYLVYASNGSIKRQLFNVSNATLSYSECGFNMTDGTYRIDVYAYDNYSASSVGESADFSINSTITTHIDPASTANDSYVNTLRYWCHIDIAPDIYANAKFYRTEWDCAQSALKHSNTHIDANGNFSDTVIYTCDRSSAVYYECDIVGWFTADTCSYTTVSVGHIPYYVNGRIPDVTLSTPTNTTTYITSLPYGVNLTYAAYDVFRDTCSYKLDSGTKITLPSCANVTINVSTFGQHTIELYVNDSGGLQNNVSATFTLTQAPAINATYSNYFNVNGSNYVRHLNYSILYTCNQSNTIIGYVNGAAAFNFTPTCDATVKTYNGVYTHSVEGNYNISFSYALYDTTQTTKTNFISDLYAPVITQLSITLSGGFLAATATLNISCTDISQIISYNMTFNHDIIFIGNKTQNTTQSNNTASFESGLNTLIGTCTDSFSSTKTNTTTTVYSTLIVLIDEISNVPFDVSNLSKVRLYRDDNSSYFDFKANGTNQLNITVLGAEKLRLELTYTDNTIVTRYVDLSLVNGTSLRLCANLEGTTHYEQLILSATQSPVLLKSDYASCYVAADYTHFAYQSGYLLKAFTIARGYSLYNFKNGAATYLASIDGSLASYVNLDSIEFSTQPFTVNTQGESLTFNKLGNGTIYIYYQNPKKNIEDINVTIRELDNGAVVYSNASFTDPNLFGFVFNYSAYGNSSTFFTIKVDKTDTEGYETTLTRYFNGQAFSKTLRAEFAIVIAIFVLIAGLTIAGINTTFGWLGGLMSFATVALLAFAVPTWYVLFFQAIAAVIGLYLVIVPFVTKKVQLV